MNRIKAIFITLGRFGRKAAPTACACAGALGVVATGYSAAKAGKIVGAWEERYEQTMPIKKKIRTYAKPVIIGGVSIAMIFTGDRLHAKRYAALGAAAKIIQERSRMMDYVLENKPDANWKEDKKTATKIADQTEADDIWEKCKQNGIAPVDTHTGNELWYEPISKTWFLASSDHVTNSEYHINRNFTLRGYAPFSEFLRFLLMEDPSCDKPGYDMIHWDIYEGEEYYGYKWIDFVHHNDCYLRDGTKYNMIFYPFPPHLSEK